MNELVLCRSETEYAEQPVALMWEGVKKEVLHVVASWRTPAGKVFRVQVENEQIYELSYYEEPGTWSIKLVS